MKTNKIMSKVSISDVFFYAESESEARFTILYIISSMYDRFIYKKKRKFGFIQLRWTFDHEENS